MARRWTTQEEELLRAELVDLYVTKNLTIFEIAKKLGIKYQTVYDRLLRLGIQSNPTSKLGNAQNRRGDVILPKEYSPDLAEFFGIMLGDGHLAHFQMMVTLGTKESEYVLCVQKLMKKLFSVRAHHAINHKGYHTVYIGSRNLVQWFEKEGLVANKVKLQVGVPEWIFEKDEYMMRFLKGFFDTDGSVYKLKFGIQISFCNHSIPILRALRSMLKMLKYSPSAISGWQLYLTKREDVARFFKQIKPANSKHVQRYNKFKSAGSPVEGGS